MESFSKLYEPIFDVVTQAFDKLKQRLFELGKVIKMNNIKKPKMLKGVHEYLDKLGDNIFK